MPGTLGRVLIALAGLLLLLVCLPSDAEAHGGNFRMGNPDPGFPRPSGGKEPRRSRPVTTLPDGVLRRRYDWRMWWSLNAEAWDLPRGTFCLPGSIEVTPSAPGGVPGPTAPRPSTQDLLLERARNRIVLPYLRRAAAPAGHTADDVRGAALIAWARIANDEAVRTVLRHYARDDRYALEVRESAVLGLGMLRRARPALQLPVEELTDLRALLLGLFDDEKSPSRIRAFALYALGLLADQPWDARNAMAKQGRAVSRALVLRLEKEGLASDLRGALLVTLGMQPPEGVPDGVRLQLERLALGRGAFGRRWTATERAHALQACVRLDAFDAVRLIQAAAQPSLRSAPGPSSASRSYQMEAAAMLALAEVAPRLGAVQRRRAALWLQEEFDAFEDPRLRGLAYLALGAVLGADLRAGSTLVLDGTKAKRILFEEACEGSLALRPYAALALAVASRCGRLASRPAGVFRAEACKRLVRSARYARGSDEVMAAHVAAVGLARAQAARPQLLKILENGNRGPEIRGYAARALGMLGGSDRRTIEALLEATRDRVHPCVQEQATRALGRLAAPEACDELLRQLEEKDAMRGVVVSVTLSLGHLGDPKAADRLVALASRQDAGVYVRSMAVVALGLIFDPERPPSRVRMRTHANYMALTGSLWKVLGIL